jgi:hypothetical protein
MAAVVLARRREIAGTVRVFKLADRFGSYMARMIYIGLFT